MGHTYSNLLFYVVFGAKEDRSLIDNKFQSPPPGLG